MTKTLLPILFILTTLFSACFEADSGCLEPSATNFDVTADRQCNVCCAYPTLTLNLVHRINDTFPYNLDQVYENTLGQHFMIRDIAFYLSDFSYIQNGESLPATTLIQAKKAVQLDTTEINLIDDPILVRRFSNPNQLVDTFPYDGILEGFSMRVGLKDSFLNVVPNAFPAGHVLRPQAEMLYDSTQQEYVGMYMVIVRDTLQKDQMDTLRFLSSELPAPFQIPNWSNFEKLQGYNLQVNMKINYDFLVKDVDFTQSNNTIKDKIIQNIPSSFDVFE